MDNAGLKSSLLHMWVCSTNAYIQYTRYGKSMPVTLHVDSRDGSNGRIPRSQKKKQNISSAVFQPYQNNISSECWMKWKSVQTAPINKEL